MYETIGIIPARYGSTRLNGKVLAEIAGKPMLAHVYENAKAASSLDRVLIATDDQRIFDVARSLGAEVQMTATSHRSGSERAAEVADRLEAAVIVNIQADEPMLKPEAIDQVAAKMRADPTIGMATLATRFRKRSDFHSPDIVKVIVDGKGRAIYFSRLPIPHRRPAPNQENFEPMAPITPALKHIGLYAYRRETLLTLTRHPVVELEEWERLEQLRALYLGIDIAVIEIEDDPISVDTREDLLEVRDVFEEG